MKRRARKGGAALLGALLLATPFALADPGNDATVRTEDFDLVFNNDGDDVASCPHGQTVVGGGLGTIDPPTNIGIGPSGPVNSTSVPSATHTGDKPTEWYASAYSGQASDTTLRVLAICSPSAKARLQVDKFRVGPSKAEAHVVACPQGESALGGGLGLTTLPAGGTYQESSGPLAKKGGVGDVHSGDVPRRWEVAVYNGSGATRTFQAIAICSDKVTPRITAGKINVDPGTHVEASTGCNGKRALSGGLLVLGKPNRRLDVQHNGPLAASGDTAGTTDGTIPLSWGADLYNPTSKTRFFKVLAVCA